MLWTDAPKTKAPRLESLREIMDEIRSGWNSDRFQIVSLSIMSDLTLQLTRKQQELLLRGLRYVRSSVALDAQDWTEQVELERRQRYDEIGALEEMLNGAKIVEAGVIS